MEKLLAHFVAMQAKAAKFVAPELYEHRNGELSTFDDGLERKELRNSLFADDMIYMLDGPEQREAQADAAFDFAAEAKQTLSPAWHGEKVAKFRFMRALNDSIAALQELDKCKKSLFYGKDNGLHRYYGDIDGTDALPQNLSGLPYSIQDRQLQHGVEMTLDAVYNIIHGGIGYATEAGEMLEMLRSIINGEKLDAINILEECGDGKWYMAILLDTLGYEWGEDERRVIAKLRERFPDKFTEYDANNRNLAAERNILETDSNQLDLPIDEAAVARFEASGGGIPLERQHFDQTKRGFDPR